MEQKLPEPLSLFNDAKDSFHCGFACGINRFLKRVIVS